MDSSIIVPITLWNSSYPKFRISCISVTPNFRKLVTGSHDGQLCLWNLNVERRNVVLKALLLGHDHSLTSTICTNEFVISTCEGGEMCRWNLEDGYCEKKRKSTKNSWYVHRNVQLLKRTPSEHELLLACGDYPGVLVYHSVTLQLICKLFSKTDYNWISNFNSFFRADTGDTIVFGVASSTNYAKKCLFNDKAIHLEQEINTKNLPVNNVIDIKFNQDQSKALLITTHGWLLLDPELVHLLHQFECVRGEQLSGGNFIHSGIVIWTLSGNFYIYSEVNDEYHLKAAHETESNSSSLFKSAITLARCDTNGNYYVLKGDHQGQINIWTLNQSEKELPIQTLQPLLSIKIGDEWIKLERGFFDNIVKFTTVTCCAYVPLLDKFFLGCLDGKIFFVPAMQTLMSVYMCSSTQVPSYDTLLGHTGKVNCLLYPHEQYSHHDKDHLVSGAGDFSVCLWHIQKAVLLHRFCVQGGEIQRLLVPPENYHSHVKHSVCSVASDHSVALLNLVDRRCVILTSSHMYPVVSVHWKPLDGFMLVETFDGTLFVWEIETGFLDRVLDGVHAQEVLCASEEHTSNRVPSSRLFNFHIFERDVTNSMKRDLFTVEDGHESSNYPVTVSGFRTSETSQTQIWTCNLERLIKRIVCVGNEIEQDSVSGEKLYYLTQASGPEATKKSFLYLDRIRKEKTDYGRESKLSDERAGSRAEEPRNQLGGMESILRFLLSSLHIWGLDSSVDDLAKRLGFIKPDVVPAFGIASSSGTYTLFLPSADSPQRISSSLMASTCMTMMTLSRILESVSVRSLYQSSDNCEVNDGEVEIGSWEKLYLFYERLCSNGLSVAPRPKMEILAKVWRSECLPLRSIIQKLLPSHLEALVQQEYLDLLKFWYDFLPHFKACGKTIERSDIDHTDLKTISLVLFGIVGSDLKFKSSYPTCQENYIYQTCSSLVYLLLMPKAEDRLLNDLQTMAVEFIGRGYIVWEQFLKVEKIYPILFEMCRNMLKRRFGGLSQAFDKAIAAHDALKAIALSRTSAFIRCLMKEIGHSNGSHPRLDGFSIENSKPEMLSIIVFLLEKSPYIMLLHLNEVVSIFVYCIDPSHLKQENLTDLLPVMGKFRQVDHSVAGQRIAVGLGTGSIVLYDLRAGRTVAVSGHSDSIAAVKFSEDGRHLASYSSYENRLILWQVLTGIFGLGQVQMKRSKSFPTPPIHDEEITNHLEVASLGWSSNKTVTLKLCDGTETVFQI